jgi:hypothetical protein
MVYNLGFDDTKGIWMRILAARSLLIDEWSQDFWIYNYNASGIVGWGALSKYTEEYILFSKSRKATCF